MQCTTCGVLPSITDRISSLIGSIDLPCGCRIRRNAKQPSRDEVRLPEHKKLSPASSRSSLESTEEEVPYHTLFYFPSEDHLSFYIDVDEEDEDEKQSVVSPVSPMSTSQPPDSGNRNSAILNEEYRVSSTSSISLSPSTHDTRRAKYHMKELGTFANRLEESALRAFPNRGRSRYKQVIAVLIQWGDDASIVQPEIDRLRTIFEACYGFNTQLWLIPSSSSHLKLMSLVLHFLEDYGSSDNLMIVYYGGHGVINSAGQTTWSSQQDSLSPSLDWSAIQSLFEETESDVLFLLDCCAMAASSTGGGQGVTETIAACGLEPWPPGPGRNLFTNAIISVLEDWMTRPSFTAVMLHSEVLAAIKHKKPERRKWADLQNIEDRKTPIYILNSNIPTSLSIELATRRNLNSGTMGNRASANFSRPALGPSPLNPSPVFSKFDIYNPANLLKTNKTGDLQIPHVLVSIALEEHQIVDVESWYRWIREIPSLAKYAVVEGVYKSFSTALLLSIPLLIWDMLPDDLAVSFVAYIQSRNMLAADSVQEFRRLVQAVDEPQANLKEAQKSVESETQRRQLHSYTKSVGEKRIDELMRKHTKHPTLESATLMRITNLERPQTAGSSGGNTLNIDSPTWPPNISRRNTVTRPSTSRGPDTDREATRLDSPRQSSDTPSEQRSVERPTISAGRGSNRLFDSLNSPLKPAISIPQDSPVERPQTSRGPGTKRPPPRLYSPLHSNPFIPGQNNLRPDFGQSTRGSTSLDSPFTRNNSNPFALEKYIQDHPPTRRPIRQGQTPTQSDNSASGEPEKTGFQRSERLDRGSSRRAAKLDAALADIFATESPVNDPAALAKKKEANRRSARIDAEAEFQADILETENLINDLKHEANFAREEARRAWDELGRREREERERLAKLRNGETISFGRFQLQAIGERTPDLGSKAAALLGTILSPREAMEKHRRARSEPRNGKAGNKTSTFVDHKIKLVYPPMPPPKDSESTNRALKTHEFVKQQRELQSKSAGPSKRPVAVYQPQLPSHKIPERKASLGVFQPMPQQPSLSVTTNGFPKPDFSTYSFPDADPNVMRHMMSFESNPSRDKMRPSMSENSIGGMVRTSGEHPRGVQIIERGRGRQATTYTFLDDEDLLDRELASRGVSVVRSGDKGKEKEKPKRKGSKLVKKRLVSASGDRGKKREEIVFPHLKVQV